MIAEDAILNGIYSSELRFSRILLFCDKLQNIPGSKKVRHNYMEVSLWSGDSKKNFFFKLSEYVGLLSLSTHEFLYFQSRY